MLRSFSQIYALPERYKICKKCGGINALENTICLSHHNGCGYKSFYEAETGVKKRLLEEYNALLELGVSRDVAWHFEFDV